MTEGTKSYLIGCHQFLLHPLCILLAWRLEYKKWPKWWEIICIFLHDVGICGRQYLSDDEVKIGHWKKGAKIAWMVLNRIDRILPKHKRDFNITATKAFELCAGHCPEESGFNESKLARADKRSWLVAPMWWLWWNQYVEGFKLTNPIIWKKLVRENLKREKPIGSHQLYIQNKNGRI